MVSYLRHTSPTCLRQASLAFLFSYAIGSRWLLDQYQTKRRVVEWGVAAPVYYTLGYSHTLSQRREFRSLVPTC